MNKPLRPEATPFRPLPPLVAAAAFAVGAPVFGVLSQYPEFFAVRGSTPLEVTAFAAMAVILPGLALCLLAQLLALFRRERTLFPAAGLVGVSAGVMALPFFRDTAPQDSVQPLVSSAAVAIGFAALFIRYRGVRSLVGWLAWAAVLLPLGFLFASPVKSIVLPGKPPARTDLNLAQKPPIVFVILDELPVVSLLDGKGNIDERRLPGFARLASMSTWYSHTLTPAAMTVQAVPAILSGQKPDVKKLPLERHYPKNLLNLLQDDYAYNVDEIATRLAPSGKVNASGQSKSAAQSLKSLLDDAWIVYLHAILPYPMAAKLPPIGHQWGGFARGGDDDGVAQGRRVMMARDFISRIERPGEVPQLSFVHLLLPHQPWIYYADGTKFRTAKDVPGVSQVEDRWEGPQALLDVQGQAHLEQLRLVDGIIGSLIDRMESVGAWDPSIVVVMADHGLALRSGVNARHLRPENAAEILWTTLFVKYPGQKEGKLDSSVRSSLDVVPTILAQLGARTDWPIAGVSLERSSALGNAKEEEAMDEAGKVWMFDLAVLMEGRRKHEDRFARTYGLDGRGVVSLGAYGSLIGSSLDGLPITAGGPEVGIRSLTAFSKVDPRARFVPGMINGTVQSGLLPPGSWIAIAINGTIRGVAQTAPVGQVSYFSCLVEKESFRDGSNTVEAFVVHGPPSRVELQRCSVVSA